MRRLIVFLSAAAMSASIGAQDLPLDSELLEEVEPEIRRYTVELIVFAYAENISVGTEVFLPEVIEIEEVDPLGLGETGEEGEVPDDSVPTFTDTTVPEGLVEEEEEVEDTLFEMALLLEDDLTMIDKLEHLDRLDAYEPLMHVGWTQTALTEEETPALDLREFGEPPEGLAGTLTLYLSRYLHLVVDLELDAPESEQERFNSARNFEEPVARYNDRYDYESQDELGAPLFEAEPVYEPLRYQIIENRLFKNGEIRYYDHPKFGVIAKVLRYEVPEEELPPDDTEFLLPAVVGD